MESRFTGEIGFLNVDMENKWKFSFWKNIFKTPKIKNGIFYYIIDDVATKMKGVSTNKICKKIQTSKCPVAFFNTFQIIFIKHCRKQDVGCQLYTQMQIGHAIRVIHLFFWTNLLSQDLEHVYFALVVFRLSEVVDVTFWLSLFYVCGVHEIWSRSILFCRTVLCTAAWIYIEKAINCMPSNWTVPSQSITRLLLRYIHDCVMYVTVCYIRDIFSLSSFDGKISIGGVMYMYFIGYKVYTR